MAVRVPRRTAHLAGVSLCFALLLAPTPASGGQAPQDPARFEIGVHVASKNLEGQSGPFAGPRLAVFLNSRASLEGDVDRQVRGREDARDFFLVQLKRSLPQAGGRVFVTVGGVIGTLRLGTPSAGGYWYREVGGGAIAGVGYEHPVAAHLRVRADAQALFSSIDNFVRLSAGVSVPFGPRVSPPNRLGASGGRTTAAAAPASTASSKTETRVVNVTMKDGRTLEGRLLSLTASVAELRRNGSVASLPLADVSAITTTDRLANGIWLGAILGAAGGLGLGIAIGHGYDAPYNTLFAIAMAGGGFGGGALAGGVIDSMQNGRRDLYRAGPSPLVTVRPLLGVGTTGIRAAVQW